MVTLHPIHSMLTSSAYSCSMVHSNAKGKKFSIVNRSERNAAKGRLPMELSVEEVFSAVKQGLTDISKSLSNSEGVKDDLYFEELFSEDKSKSLFALFTKVVEKFQYTEVEKEKIKSGVSSGKGNREFRYLMRRIKGDTESLLENAASLDHRTLAQTTYDYFEIFNDACELGDVEIMEWSYRKLGSDPSIFTKFDKWSCSGLYKVCLNSREKAFDWFLKKLGREKFLEELRFGYVPSAHVIFGTSDIGFVKKVLDLDPTLIDVKSKGGSNALMQACELGSLEVVKLIHNLRPGFIGEENVSGVDAFQLALDNMDFGVVSWLYEQDPTLLQPADYSRMNWLLEDEEYSLAEKLLKLDPSLIAKKFTGDSLFVYALRSNNLERAKWLYDKHPSFVTEKPIDPLISEIAEKGDIEFLKWLLEKNPALIEDVDKVGQNTFHIVCRFGNRELAEHILTLRPDFLSSVDNDQETVFFKACLSQYIDLAKWIHSIDPSQINIYNKYGQTPLHMAAERESECCLELLDWLLDKEPDLINKVDPSGKSAAFNACWGKNIKALKYLLNKDPSLLYGVASNNRTLIAEAVRAKSLKIVQYLHSLDPELKDICDASGYHPVAYASSSGLLDIVKFFIALDPSLLRKKLPDGFTLLHNACIRSSISLIRWILEEAPELANEKSHAGELPIDVLVRRNPKSDAAYDLIKSMPDCDLRCTSFIRLIHGFCESQELNEGIREILTQDELRFNRKIFEPLSLNLLVPTFLGPIKDSEALNKKASIKMHLELLETIASPELIRKFSKRIAKPSATFLTIKDYLAFLKKKIPDIDLGEIDPYKLIQKAYEDLDDREYKDYLNAGENKENIVTLKGAKSKKVDKAKVLHSLLTTIKTRKRDNAIPEGEEELFYDHLEKILKHFAADIQKGKYKSFAALNEQFFFLLDGAEVCYTVFSTRIRQLFVNRSSDVSFSQTVANQDSEKKGFESFLEKVSSENLNQAISKLFNTLYNGESGQDAHISSFLEYFLRKEGFPTPNRETYDDHLQLHAALFHVARFCKVEVSGLTSTKAEFDELYTVVAAEMKSFLIKKWIALLNVSLADKITESLNQNDSIKANEFLTEFTDWLSLHGLNAAELLEYESSYKLRPELPAKVMIAYGNANPD
ncbi:MAG: hypothetical protein S4CHLAM37_03610 [Chlamydiia bacterium]|nr:hypothetical protein [Chlamydiia bacterium]